MVVHAVHLMQAAQVGLFMPQQLAASQLCNASQVARNQVAKHRHSLRQA